MRVTYRHLGRAAPRVELDSESAREVTAIEDEIAAVIRPGDQITVVVRRRGDVARTTYQARVRFRGWADHWSRQCETIDEALGWACDTLRARGGE